MGTKKKKSQKNAAFKKVKLKIGKTLKKTNTTDTTIQARKVVLLTQLEEQTGSASAVYSYRGLSLDNLCSQLGHYSKGVRKNAIVGAKQILSNAPLLVESQLRTIIPAFARLISLTDTDATTQSQLRSLLELVCTVPAQVISPHFALFVAHILRGLTHTNESVRSFSLTVLHILLDRYPSLCRDSTDIFQTLVHFIAANKKTSHSLKTTLDFIASFLKIYDIDTVEVRDCVEVKVYLNGENPSLSSPIDITPQCKDLDPFHFPILSTVSRSGTTSSLFSSPEPFLKLSESLSPFIASVILDDDRNITPSVVKILTMMANALDRQQNKFLLKNFDELYKKSTESIRKAVKVKQNSKVAEAATFLL